LLTAVSERYRVSDRVEKSRLLDEFAVVTGYHRKHAMRVLRAGPSDKRAAPRLSRRIYGVSEREALIVLWEASDRVCSKPLKAIIPTLIEAMVRHGHLTLASQVRAALLKMSAATIDRALQSQRELCSKPAAASGLRIYDPPVDTSADFLGLARSTTRIRRGRPRCPFRSDNEGCAKRPVRRGPRKARRTLSR